jgi:E3 ubiquitin-protein ligase SHPRH
MRKEYVYARSLALAQTQYLRAHDELKMAISRLRLKANEDDESLDALDENELHAASSNYSQEKFMSLALLSQIKGKLRYLKVWKISIRNLYVFSIIWSVYLLNF